MFVPDDEWRNILLSVNPKFTSEDTADTSEPETLKNSRNNERTRESKRVEADVECLRVETNKLFTHDFLPDVDINVNVHVINT